MRRTAIKLIVWVAILLGADQLTKYLVRGNMEPFGSIDILPFFQLEYVRNRGIAFGLLEGHVAAIIFTSSLVVLLLVGAALAVRHDGRWFWPFALLVSGSIGNLLDRVLLGSVTDFLRVPHWPAFNLADIFIVTGVLLLVKSLILQVDKMDGDEEAWEEKEKLVRRDTRPRRDAEGRAVPQGQPGQGARRPDERNAKVAALRQSWR